MKVQIVGLQKKALAAYISKKYPGISVVQKNPDIVICHGGDGTLLYGEREFPGIPKVMIRNSQICTTCAKITKDTILQLIQEKQYSIVEFTKIQAETKNKKMIALNDIVVGHPHVNGTLRVKVFIKGKQYGDEVLGDGVIVSTPIGSTGYYQSITHSNFQSGIGIAFNNAVKIISHLVVDESTDVEIEVSRGPGVVACDNDEEVIPISTGDRVRIVAAKEKAKIIEFPGEHARFNVDTSSNRLPIGFCQICGQHYER